MQWEGGGGGGEANSVSNFTAMISHVVVMNFKQATVAKPKKKS